MATAEQLKSLIKSHFDDDRERFRTISLQLAAHEARQGHGALANEIKAAVDSASTRNIRLFPAKREYDDLIDMYEPDTRLSEMVVSEAIKSRLQRIIKEYRQQATLKKHGMQHRRKVLVTGPPGTGKTMTARVLANELSVPLFVVLTDRIVTKYMGETSAKLRIVFECIRERHGVYLFDEFDAIGGERSVDNNDVGEIRRVLNSFLQFIEQDDSDSVIIAATNNLRMLDQALFRRFDDVIRYESPTLDEARHLAANRLGLFRARSLSLTAAIHDVLPLSHAEIAEACDDAVKECILSGKDKVTTALLKAMLRERHSVYSGVERSE